jgi:hypothetical protein
MSDDEAVVGREGGETWLRRRIGHEWRRGWWKAHPAVRQKNVYFVNSEGEVMCGVEMVNWWRERVVGGSVVF